MSDWEVRFSQSRKRAYFYSETTKESRWDAPSDLTEADIASLPGAEHLTYSGNTTKSNKPSLSAEDQGRAAKGEVRASHLLIKHTGSRRPSSWKEKVVTRSKEEAIEILKQHQKELLEAPDLQVAFAELAKTESDCSSARSQGDLGWFGRRQMQQPFEEAAYATPVGQMSDIISTDSGVHLVLRTG